MRIRKYEYAVFKLSIGDVIVSQKGSNGYKSTNVVCAGTLG